MKLPSLYESKFLNLIWIVKKNDDVSLFFVFSLILFSLSICFISWFAIIHFCFLSLLLSFLHSSHPVYVDDEEDRDPFGNYVISKSFLIVASCRLHSPPQNHLFECDVFDPVLLLTVWSVSWCYHRKKNAIFKDSLLHNIIETILQMRVHYSSLSNGLLMSAHITVVILVEPPHIGIISSFHC